MKEAKIKKNVLNLFSNNKSFWYHKKKEKIVHSIQYQIFTCKNKQNDLNANKLYYNLKIHTLKINVKNNVKIDRYL